SAIEIERPSAAAPQLASSQILAWFPEHRNVRLLHIHFSHAERNRHKRNYAHGELGEDNSFYFRGPQKKLNLRAYNLTTFVRLAEGVDPDTWLFHLKRGDYSKWFRDVIKDEGLATDVAQYESEQPLNPGESLKQVKLAIEKRYTAPA